MTTESQNVSRLKEAYAQWSGQKGANCDCWMEIMADDISLESLANGSPAKCPFLPPAAARHRSLIIWKG
jgi:hypothetical protein